MTGQSPLVPLMPVLADEGLPSEFVPAIQRLGARWTAPSGRTFAIAVEGSSVRVSLVLETLQQPPGEDEVDADLFELICAVHDGVGGEWSARAVENVARAWGWEPRG